MKLKRTLLAACAAAFIAAQSAFGILNVTGSPATGLTIELTESVTFNIVVSASVNSIVFDDWVTNHDSQDSANTTPNTASYRINAGSTQTAPNAFFLDNQSFSIGDITADDGHIGFTGVPVTAGNTFTIVAQTWTVPADPDFNPEVVQTFTGNVFLTGYGGGRVSDIQAVPEPGTYAALAGLAALGFVVLRRRRAAVSSR